MTEKFFHATQKDTELLQKIQSRAFAYFLKNFHPHNGLVADSTRANAPASIAATGMALSCYPVAVERNFWSHAEALKRALTTLRFFTQAPQSRARDSSGYHGFFYHFLEMESGRRAWHCELSSIDTALLLMGVLTVAAYFGDDTAEQRELRERSETLINAVDWNWMRDGHREIGHGWKPERGFLKARWQGYNEALLLQILALGSPTHAVPHDSYDAWLDAYKWKTIYGYELAYCGPLFVHQYPHIWLDLRNQRDRFMREHDSDYWENSRRATLIQREYARRNPHNFASYGENCWGISASDGPGPQVKIVDGKVRRFYAYRARGVPFGPDDGTLSPWCTAASLPFAPEIVLPAIHHFHCLDLMAHDDCGAEETFNRTYSQRGCERLGWISDAHLGINQGPLILMLENYRTGFLWNLLRDCPILRNGLGRADFQQQ